jgi:phosphoglycolate phosphatase-like HAD superfamily hydrolase
MQMKKLIQLIRESGMVSGDRILDESDYKAIYNSELIRLVNIRQKKILNGELTIEDFTIKNIIPFLKKLKNAGIKLYLTSGTDVEDVKNEARFMGYEDLFEGGIHGAVGDIRQEAKKIVLDHILDKIKNTGEGQLVAFGDGPVEIRETKKRGGITVGVATDELKRYGLNEKKRTRLIKAGSDIIIPDFTQINQLTRLLNIE